MRYTFAQNAISSLSIAIENFKKFYYYEEEYKISEIDEAKSALSKVTKSLKLEDILISEEKFQTIKYIETIDKYNDLFHKSKKVYQVLNSLGQKRNRIYTFWYR